MPRDGTHAAPDVTSTSNTAERAAHQTAQDSRVANRVTIAEDDAVPPECTPQPSVLPRVIQARGRAVDGVV
eukprot:m.29361 g.29361  ORF g.29361 m.29361 type:complete len:71 (-) comp13702_c0_seq2:1435-1647(-)